MVCPINYHAGQNLKSGMKNSTYGVENHRVQLSYDVEHGILKIFEREVITIKAAEPLKQELMSFNDYSSLEIFRAIDQFAHGVVNCDNLRMWLLQFEFCSNLEESDLKAWIRRYDRDADGQLDYADMISALAPNCNYTYKAELSQEEPEVAANKNNYESLDAGSLRIGKESIQPSRLSKTTAASVNEKGAIRSVNLPKTKKFGSNAKRSTAAKTSVGRKGQISTGGDILSYAYTADAVEDQTSALDTALQKMQAEEKYRLAEI